MNKIRVIWIDDEIDTIYLRSFVKEFEENGIDVIKVKKIDDIDATLQNEDKNSLTMIILDIAMPPKENISIRDARGGVITGQIILEELLKNDNVSCVKKVVFTQVEDEEVEQYCNNKHISYFKKEDYFEDEFYDAIMDIINNKEENE